MGARKTTGARTPGAPRHSAAPGRRPSARGAGSSRPDGRSSAPPTRAASAKKRPERAQRRSTSAVPGGSTAYNAPAVWTKNAPADRGGSPVARVLSGIGGALGAFVSLIGAGLAALVRAVGALFSRSRVAVAVAGIAVLLMAGCLVDLGVNAGRAYPGVTVGAVDAGGKTAEEIAAALDEAYGARLAAGSVTVYANDQAASHVADEAAQAQDAALAEQLAVEEARANRQAWTADAASLEAHLPSADLAAEALAVGRGDGGLWARLDALFSGRGIEVRVAYGPDALERLAADIDRTIGEARVDFDVAVEDGRASVTEGHDGTMMDRVQFARELDRAFLENGDGSGSFVARAQYAPLRIDEATAQATADKVNEALARGARFTYEGAAWEADAAEAGAWVGTRVEEHEGGFSLVPFIDEAKAKPALLTAIAEAGTGAAVPVTFQVDGDDVTVRTDGVSAVPCVEKAVADLDAALFGGAAPEDGGAAPARDASVPAPSGLVQIAIGSKPAPAELTFDEALDRGIIGAVSSFTTEFNTGEGTENRNHNIRLVSELLSNSVAKAKGGRWSFNETAGECNAEKGFLGAGAIIAGEYDDAVGGGICQVATTVFNAIYDAGYPVVTRHNHSLYIASYPAGRDAAVSWPDLDLVWENDGDSDVLMRLSCGEGEVTATLYGVDPGYQVSTDTGDWKAGAHYTVKTKVDESMQPGTSYIETKGTDGLAISVIRTVRDKAGALLHEDVFASTYDPVTEVVVQGPKASAGTTDETTDGTNGGEGSGESPA